jgi:hypothetical protein
MREATERQKQQLCFTLFEKLSIPLKVVVDQGDLFDKLAHKWHCGVCTDRGYRVVVALISGQGKVEEAEALQ